MATPSPNYAVGSGSTLPGAARRCYTQFLHEPITSKRAGGAATGSAGDRNVMLVPGVGNSPAVPFEWTVIGTQTILTPVLTANGLDIGMDQTSGDGLEITQGITARSPFSFVVGTDRAFFLSVKVKVEDASGVNPLLVGFRKSEAFATDWNDYNDLAAIGIQGTSNPNLIKLATILTNAATVVTDTTNTWADAAEKTLRVQVSSDGVVTYQIDGSAPTTVAAYTFTNGLTLVPFLRMVNAADVGGTVELSEWDCGLV